MFCEKCGNQVNDDEKFCSKCGAPVNRDPGASGQNNSVAQGTTGTTGQNTAGTSNAVSEGAEKAKALASEGAEKAKALASEGAEKAKVLASEGAEKAKAFGQKAAEKSKELFGKVSQLMGSGPRGKMIIALAGVCVVLFIGLVANASRISNWAHRTFSSSEKYYQYVEKSTVNEAADIITDVYGEAIAHVDVFNLGVDGELNVSIGEDVRDLLGTLSYLGRMAGLNSSMVDWVESLSVSGGFAIKDNVVSLNVATSANNDSIMSMEFVGDLEERMMYLGLPDLSSTFLGFDADELLYLGDDFDLEDYQEFVKNYIKVLPSQSTVKKLASRYLKLALGCVDDVDVKTGKTLKAGGIQQKTTLLEITIDSDTAADMAQTVLEALAEDKDVEKIIRNIAEFADENSDMLGINFKFDADDIYDAFQDGIDEVLDDLDEDDFYLGEDGIQMELYVDSKGVIRGRTLEVDGVNVTYKMPVKGSKFGYELSVGPKYSSGAYSLEGEGKVSHGKINGTFNINLAGLKVPVDIKVSSLNKNTLLRGKLNGTIELTMNDTVEDIVRAMLGSNMGQIVSGISGLLDDLSVVLDASSTDSSMDYELSILSGKDNLLTVGMNLDISNGSKAKIPSGKSVVEVEDSDDLLDWLEDVNWDKVISKLEKTDIPDDVIDILEDIADFLEDGDIGDLQNMLRYLM